MLILIDANHTRATDTGLRSGKKQATHDGDVPLNLALTVCDVALGGHGVAALDGLDNGDVGEEHDYDGDEEAEDEDGDDVGLVDGGVVGLGPVDLARPITTVWRGGRGNRCSLHLRLRLFIYPKRLCIRN